MFAASNETWKNVVKAMCFFIPLATGIEADEVPEIGSTRKVEQHRLIRLRDFVGEWRGVGQVRRGSTKGGWIERTTWTWKISPQHASLNFVSKQNIKNKSLRKIILQLLESRAMNLYYVFI